MDTNEQSSLALKYILNTDKHIFLTGKAGTGKTTFLHYLKKISPKRMIVVAPTGVAAINAGGVTIHSFFQLPFGPYISEDNATQANNRFNQNRFHKEKINIIKSLDLLVIDEISMVRADLLDALSDTLRRYRNSSKPFGGVQLLLIGDLQQLAPVAKEEEWNLLKSYYPSPYFFDSHALRDSEYLSIELTHVYRQRDNNFIQILNQIRNNNPDESVLQKLNARYIPHLASSSQDDYVILTTHNHQAQRINNTKLESIPNETYTFKAVIKGDFPTYSYPTDEVLNLKKGTQVMFMRNDSSGDKEYYNGKIGKIIQLDKKRIIVADETGKNIEVRQEEWKNIKYTINEETKEITEEIAGSFIQYPLKAAWAITIHKSQGLTFERVIIDVASAFSHGQVYVALSRCKTLEGIILNSPITRQSLIRDNYIDQYTSSLSSKEAQEGTFDEAQKAYYIKIVTELFQFDTLQKKWEYTTHTMNSLLGKLYPEACLLCSEMRDTFRKEITEVGLRFQQQLKRMVSESIDYRSDTTIQERIQKGTYYFLQQLEPYSQKIQSFLHLDIDNKETKKKTKKQILSLLEELTLKSVVLTACHDHFDTSNYLTAKAKALINSPVSSKKRREKGASKEAETTYTGDILHPELFEQLRQWRSSLSYKKKVPAYTILQQKALIGISNLLPRNSKELMLIPGIGKKVIDLYGEDLLAIIDKYNSHSSGL